MIRILQCKCRVDDGRSLTQLAADYLKIPRERIRHTYIHKRSIDARKKEEIFYVYSLDVEAAGEREILKKNGKRGVVKAPDETWRFHPEGTEPLPLRPVIIGAGPAGLFAAYELALCGFRPLVLERGKAVEERQRDVEAFWRDGVLNPESNVQFGERGAGTFSDGKLNTMVKDPSGRIRRVLSIFVECGADPAILYDSKPHIGTDCLRTVIRRLREKICEAGGEVRFQCRATDFEIEDGRLTGLVYEEKGQKQRMDASVCILAVGHSARDTFETLLVQGVPMEPKAFAVGFRIEHPQAMIQESQYGRFAALLPPAPYKVTAKAACGRGVYSFCMCPGGTVVNASSEEGRLAVNGMSNHARDGRNANSAIVVTVQPEDYAAFCTGQDASLPAGRTSLSEANPLAGMFFQRELEERAWQMAKGRIPVQLYGDYREGRLSSGLGEVIPDIRGAYSYGNLREILPGELGTAIAEGISAFGRQIRGFDREDAVLSGVESRTSSPVRVLRDENRESAVRGLYPCGEGAGYAGGITSAAVDGIKTAQEIAGRYAKP